MDNFTDSTDCGYCLEGYVEVNSVCYSIEAFQTDMMEDLFTYLLEEYLPDFAWNVTRAERLDRFIAMAQIISEHNVKNESDYELGVNSEAFFTSEERSRRLGVRYDLAYDYSKGSKGKFGRFQRDTRALRDANGRLLQQAAVDWHERGYTTRVKNQVRATQRIMFPLMHAQRTYSLRCGALNIELQSRDYVDAAGQYQQLLLSNLLFLLPTKHVSQTQMLIVCLFNK